MIDSEVLDQLRSYYTRDARHREAMTKSDWKLEERSVFLAHLKSADCRTLIEVGAGTGQDSLYFQEAGLDVTATDLSEEMVRYCADKGLRARVMDFDNLDFPASSFDALYAMNCLLHVPRTDLPEVLDSFARLLPVGGLFYLGIYGGLNEEGLRDGPGGKRWFVSYSDESIKSVTSQRFEMDYFNRVDFGSDWPQCFQSLVLRKKDF